MSDARIIRSQIHAALDVLREGPGHFVPAGKDHCAWCGLPRAELQKANPCPKTLVKKTEIMGGHSMSGRNTWNEYPVEKA